MCPVCLGHPDDVVLGAGGCSARCRCEGCDAAWTVSMSTGQFLRVTLAPPLGLQVMGCSYWGEQPVWPYPF